MGVHFDGLGFCRLGIFPKLRALFLWHHLGGHHYQFRRSDYDEFKLSEYVKVCRDSILPRVSKPNGYSRDLLHATQSYDMGAYDFPNLKIYRLEPATLGMLGGHVTSPPLNCLVNVKQGSLLCICCKQIPSRSSLLN